MLRNALIVGLGMLLMNVGAAAADEFGLTGGRVAKFGSRAGVAVFARDAGLSDFPDPRCPSVTQITLSTEEGVVQNITLPCANWELRRGKYVYLDRAGVHGGVQLVLWKAFILKIKMVGAGYEPIQGPVDFLEVRLTVGPDQLDIGPHTYCGRFTQFRANQSDLVFAVRPSQPCDPLDTPTPGPTNTPAANTPTPPPTNTPGGPTEVPTSTPVPPTPTDTPEPTGDTDLFRLDSLGIQEPLLRGSSFCLNLNSIANSLIQQSLNNDGDPNVAGDEDGFLDLSLVALFKPLDQSIPGGGDVDIGIGQCTVGQDGQTADATTTCGPGTTPLESTTYTNDASSCDVKVAGTIGANNNDIPYNPINSPAGPCFKTASLDASFDMLGITVPLQDAQFAATYDADPASNLQTGVIRGFLSEAVAETILIPEGIGFGLDNQPLTMILNGSPDNACSNADDRDTHNGQTGWWFYLNYTAVKNSWTGP